MKLGNVGVSDKKNIVQLSREVGWDYCEEDVEEVLKSGRMVGHRLDSGEVISSAALFPYGEELATLGVVIVNPAYKGRGLGRELAEAVLASKGERSILLVATREGKPLYEKMGFRETGMITKYIASTFHPAQIQHELFLAPMTYEDIEEVAKLDTQAFRGDRIEMLRARYERSISAVVLRDSLGRMIGYGMCVQGSVHRVAGPVVAPTAYEAAGILQELLRMGEGSVRLDTSTDDDAFHSYLEGFGFEEDSHSPIMVLGEDVLAARNGMLFALASQALG
ncbi:GNAT family N-acetyltransferase [Rossellomorea marisflavi]|uniref:GNAT family N-acetyltransferase n=1 Tax=Rossellomorea marisflavi TaxID=189381 RepID=UPI0027A8D6E9|nr:GNAT family N-acetyltransferase [Rossellomorea marisflavi]UTE71770.1 GNAT family N-acetyltransferase [Rossellomorea marisflavi]